MLAATWSAVAHARAGARIRAELAALPAWQPPEQGCKDAMPRATLAEAGGSFLRLDAGRWAVTWFPERWRPKDGIVYVLGGNDGCTVKAWVTWYRMSTRHKAAIVALHYGDPGSKRTDDGQQILANLRTLDNRLTRIGVLDRTPRLLYGFSQGASKAISVAFYDRDHMFNAVVLDSGASDLSTRPPPSIQQAQQDPAAFEDTHFWLYCGADDLAKFPGATGSMCSEMEQNAAFITERGGTIDQLYQAEGGGHGMFGGLAGGEPTDPLKELFRYVKRPPKRVVTSTVDASPDAPAP